MRAGRSSGPPVALLAAGWRRGGDPDQRRGVASATTTPLMTAQLAVDPIQNDKANDVQQFPRFSLFFFLFLGWVRTRPKHGELSRSAPEEPQFHIVMSSSASTALRGDCLGCSPLVGRRVTTTRRRSAPVTRVTALFRSRQTRVTKAPSKQDILPADDLRTMLSQKVRLRCLLLLSLSSSLSREQSLPR